ncbi:MAG: radical SAM protein [Endomicrobiales bacterium]
MTDNVLYRLLEEGKQYNAKGKYDLARDAFERALQLDRACPETNFELGKTYYLLKDHRQSLAHLKHSATTPARILSAKIFKETGRPREALGELKALISGNDPEVVREFEELLSPCAEDLKRRNFRGDYDGVLREAREFYALLPPGQAFFRNRLLSEIEIAQKKTVLESRMRNLIVTLATDCNLRCVMCEWVRAKRWEIPRKTLQEVRASFPYLERIVWQGGEVFLYKGLRDLIEEAGRFPHLQQVITTNGLLIDEKWAEVLIRNNVDLTFSVDGATREVYEKIRQGARYDLLVENIRRFVRLKEEARSSVKTNLHIVVMRSNYRQLEDYIDFAHDNGFKYIAFLAIGGNYDNPENIFYGGDREAREFLSESLVRIREKTERYGILLENRLPVKARAPEEHAGKAEEKPAEGACPGVPSPDGKKAEQERMICHLPWIQLYIDFDGSLRPDCVCRREESMGNVAALSLLEAWNHPKMQEYRRLVAGNACDRLCNPDCTENRVSERYLKFS